MTSFSSAWFVRGSKPSAPRIRLFCFPYAGGSASIYRRWGEVLNDIDVCAVQLPGHGSRFRERPLNDVSELVAELAGAVQPHLGLPFAFFGHSMGALVAFELARELRRRRWKEPVLLFVSACRALQDPVDGEPISYLPDTEFISEIRQLYSGIPDEVMAAPEFLAIMLPALRADMRILESYRYTEEAPLDCSISCFGGNQDSHVSPQSLGTWREQTQNAFSLRLFPGGHFFIDSDRATVLQAIAEDLQPWKTRSA